MLQFKYFRFPPIIVPAVGASKVLGGETLSQQPFPSEARQTSRCSDDMIVDYNLERIAHGEEKSSRIRILLARLSAAGGVVVHKDDAPRIKVERAVDDALHR